ncbi:MAG: omega-6 fatty acid desaturase (delta-12 desaturase) [Phenylobacterium sp.]|jgi:omega-6 fatty acid desaturase (delta-12 desaturase)
MMIGSSYYRLPMVLRWFTNNICIHHVHHYQPRIPSHNINRCFNEVAYFRQVEPLTMVQSAKNMNLALWDEKRQRLIRFSEVEATVSVDPVAPASDGKSNEQSYEQG